MGPVNPTAPGPSPEGCDGVCGELRHLEQRDREVTRREAYLRAIFDAEPECVKVVDAAGRLVEMNPAGLAMLEVDTLEEAQHMRLLDYLLPEHREAFARLHQEVLRGGTGVLEFEILGRRGTRRWLETHATPLRDEKGSIEALLGITRDVTERRRAAAALERTQVQYAGLVHSIDGIVWEADAESLEFTFVSDRAVHILGYPIDSWLTEPCFWTNHIHPEDREHTVRSCLMSTGREEGHVLEYRMVAADGRVVWLRDIVAYVKEPDGRALLRGIMVDITPRKAMEVQLEHLHRVRTMLSEINQALVRGPAPGDLASAACRIAVEVGLFRLAWIGMRDPGDGRLTITAHAGATSDTMAIVERLTGAPRPEEGCAETARALSTGEVSVCNDVASDPRAAHWREAALERGYRSMASVPVCRGGRVVGIFNLYAGEPEFFDADEVRLLEELAQDIAFGLDTWEGAEQQREAEEAVRVSEARFRELAETIQEVFWITDAGKSRMLYVSPAYEAVWRRTREEVYADPLSWAAALHPEDRDRVMAAVAQRQILGEYDEEYRIVQPDGEVRWIRERAYPVRNAGGQVERIVGVAHDITERVVAEERLRDVQRMESVGQLAAGVAHDFNNVLTVINGIAEMTLANLPEGSPLRQDLTTIRDAGARATELTRQMLAVGRKQMLRPKPVNLNVLVTEMETLLRSMLGEDIEIVVRLATDLAPVVVDPGQFHQVILNLASNSRDAMPRGGTLTIETRNAEPHDPDQERNSGGSPAPGVALAISDTGEGIDPRIRPHLFEPFFTTKDSSRGTGLGLATVHGIVTQSGGTVQVQSEVGRGSTFTIHLPAAPPGSVASEREPGPAASGGAESVLVVDDNAAVRDLVRRVLEKAGYRVLTAASGQEALERLENATHPVHLVMTDVVMPGMSGPELAEQIRRRELPVRILFTTGYTDDAVLRHGVSEEGLHLISKPYSTGALTAKVREMLDL